MSKLLGAKELAPAATQLPLSWYFDPAIYEREMQLLFKNGPGYVGHRLMAPEANTYRALEMTGGAWALVNNGQSIEMVSNICRHRQALMLDGSGKLAGGNIVCPLHRWTYDSKGALLGAPHFADQPCLHLPKKQLTEWNGMLFHGGRDIAADLRSMGCAEDLNFDGYQLAKVDVVEYNFNWKTFIEVYLEDYHVVPFHPGLGHFVNCDELKWEFGDWFSVQTVGVNSALAKPGSEVYRKWHESVLNFRNGEPPKHGAIWLTYYPNIMVEWYPHVLVISTLIPRGPEKCSNVVEFYYPEEIALFEPEFMAAEQKAYEETALEDEEICQRMNDGRKLLWQEGREEHGPYQSPMEDGMVHFHEFMRREIGA
ncbi:MAG TPA: aromatic ring-hydroxylating dioxygenase subunit alpha [Usitatibacteraceae bacterium]|nr:aromatic ring-hydroxylating dioxygenase subunit alpha [Usitatibacteraceae bacterium]